MLAALLTALALSSASSSFQSLQAGVYSDEANAARAVEQLRKAGYISYFLIAPSPEQSQSTYKVRVGRFADPGSAQAAKDRLHGLGFEKAWLVSTDLSELRSLSGAVERLVDANWTAIEAAQGEIALDGPLKRIRLYVDDYLELALLADPGQRPGKSVTSLGVWDTNPDPQREIFAVLDGVRAYALYWDAEQACYQPQLLREGSHLDIGPDLDLLRGPDRFVTVRYQRGGALYQETGLAAYRWDEGSAGYREVGVIPLEVVDHGEEPWLGLHRTRTIDRKENLAGLTPDRQLLLRDLVAGSNRPHLDVWDWDGSRLLQRKDPEWFEQVLGAGVNEERMEAFFGAGIDRALDGDLAGAEKIFTVIVQEPAYRSAEVAIRAEAALKEIAERKRRANTLNQTGFEELKQPGGAALAVQDLEEASGQNPGDSGIWYNLAVARAAGKELLGALRALRRAVESDATLRTKARTDPDLAQVRSMPEAQELLR